ncbi:thymidylate kinase [Pseudacidovorax intermedius]|uniref:Thymidylate kinase n=1 Tax=Pseudacidovorax intermedius TaxID=433924 RepID=A0A370FH37_9BURK|nr:hypothetical protein [Pseudacidovorax intermedius]RDI24964.1 thymidylate kinase [Pseudacidovorax intermedius]
MSFKVLAFEKLIEIFEEKKIRYAVLSGADDYPLRIGSDVDVMVDEYELSKAVDAVRHLAVKTASKIVQCMQHEISAKYFVLVKKGQNTHEFFHPDLCGDYRRNTKLWIKSSTILDARIKDERAFWRPSIAHEFEYYLIKRIDKASITAEHIEKLNRLMAADMGRCTQVVQQYFWDVKSIFTANGELNADGIISQIKNLRHKLHKRSQRESALSFLKSNIAALRLNVERTLRPTGLTVAFLGADGSGKSTMIQSVQRAILPAFRKTAYYHLRPRFLGKGGSEANVSSPHEVRERSTVQTLAKIALFLLDYNLGYLSEILNKKIRSNFIVFDRYFYDLEIDPLRYRIASRDVKLVTWSQEFVLKPDLVIVCTAEPASMVRRKSETTEEMARLLSERYIKFQRQFSTKGRTILINTESSIEECSYKILEFIFEDMEHRWR